MILTILNKGEEIKFVGVKKNSSGYLYGQINLPKALIGRPVKVSLLTLKEEEELIKSRIKTEEFRIEARKEEKRLEKHLIKLRRLKEKRKTQEEDI